MRPERRRRDRSLVRPGAALLLGLAAWPLAADPPDLVTDRPDQTESAAIVPPGTVQLELGATFTRDEEAGERVETLEGPGTLARFGISERLELRLGWRGWVSAETRRDGADSLPPTPRLQTTEGRGDAQLGFKLGLRSGRGKSPQMALLAGATIPAGDAELTSDEVDPFFRLSFAHTLSRQISLGYNVGASRESDPVAGEGTTSFLYTLVLGLPLAQRWGAFVEVFGETDEGSAGESRNALDAGLTFLARPNLQLDLAAGRGLSAAADDWFAGLGLSVRLPQ